MSNLLKMAVSETIRTLHRRGWSQRRIAESFDRWTSVYLNYEKAWWDHEHRSWVDEKFHIIDRVSLYDRDRQLKQGSLKLSSFTWSDVLFRSFQSGYLKRIDFEFYISLDHPTAKRMYRFLDKRFYLKRQEKISKDAGGTPAPPGGDRGSRTHIPGARASRPLFLKIKNPCGTPSPGAMVAAAAVAAEAPEAVAGETLL